MYSSANRAYILTHPYVYESECLIAVTRASRARERLWLLRGSTVTFLLTYGDKVESASRLQELSSAILLPIPFPYEGFSQHFRTSL